MSQNGKGRVVSVWIAPEEDAHADKLIDLELARSFSDAVRWALSFAAVAVDRISLTMKA